MMKAQLLLQPDDVKNHPLSIREVEIPKPNSQQVLIKVNVCGICRTDLHVIEGDLELKELPIIPGHQVVGEIRECGSDVRDFKPGDRVGVAWLQTTCGQCRFCQTGRENLCESAIFTGWTALGGFAEYMVTSTQFLYPLPEQYSDQQAAPLLCAGIIGYRSIRLMDISDWAGRRIGIYGFGAAGHIAIQLLTAWGADVYVCTRNKAHQKLAQELGAVWTGGTIDIPPVLLDAAVVFAPAGEIVPAGLKALDRGAPLILAGIHMSPIPCLAYDTLYGEKVIRSVMNNTKQDGIEFLKHAARVGVRTHTQEFPLENANEGLCALKYDQIQGAGVLVMK